MLSANRNRWHHDPDERESERGNRRAGALPFCRRHGASLLLLLGGLLFLPTAVFAANGDLLNTITDLGGETDVIDACRAVDGSVWVTSQTTGNIIHLDESLVVVPADTIPNHHGGLNPLTNPLSGRGIAFREDTGTLMVLARRKPIGQNATFEFREVQTDGTQISQGPIPVNPPNPESADLMSLSWDPDAGQLLSVDCANDRIVRLNTDGNNDGFIKLPGDLPEHTTIHTGGISFESGTPLSFIHVTLGDVFSNGANRIERILTSGFSSGLFTPIPDTIDFTTVHGMEACTITGNDVWIAIAGDRIHVIDRDNSAPLSPSGLVCQANQQGHVEIRWNINGPSAGNRYPFGVRILRNGAPLISDLNCDQPPAPTTECETYTDTDPPEGEVTYCVQGSGFDGAFGQEVCCTVNAPQGRLRWVPFPGQGVFDLTRDKNTGKFYCTDIVAGEIRVLDADYTDLGTIPSPYARPGGIAFIPSGDEGNGSLVVSDSEGLFMREIRLDGSNITFDFVMNPPSGADVKSGLTYNGDLDLLTYVDKGHSPTDDRQRVSITRIGDVSAAYPPIVPPEVVLNGLLEGGIAADPSTASFYTILRSRPPANPTPRLVRIIQQAPGGPPQTGQVDIPLANIVGATSELPDGIGGIEIIDNTAVIVGRTANTLFEVLIDKQGAPFTRGDVDFNDQIDTTDAIVLASYLFIQDYPAIPCPDAGDANDDGFLSVADPVRIVFFLFLGGAQPAPPYPSPGFDPTVDELNCVSPTP